MTLNLPKPSTKYDMASEAQTRTALEKADAQNLKQNSVLTSLKFRDAGTGAIVTLTVDDGVITGISQSNVPTRTVLKTGTAATYTTPAGCRQLRVRMVGGGGPGYGSGVGTIGGTTSFSGVTALGGDFSSGADGANGSGNGSGTASLRIAGSGSQATPTSGAVIGGAGANSPFGGAGRSLVSGAGVSAQANSGSGGSGDSPYSGGGAGEYVELIIDNPAPTYTYTVGAGGLSVGSAGNGGSGVIIIEEIY